MSLKGHARIEHCMHNTTKFLRSVFQRKIQAVKTIHFTSTLSFSLLSISPQPQNTSIVSFAKSAGITVKGLDTSWLCFTVKSPGNVTVLQRQHLSPPIGRNVLSFQKSKTSICSDHTGMYVIKGCAFWT